MWCVRRPRWRRWRCPRPPIPFTPLLPFTPPIVSIASICFLWKKRILSKYPPVVYLGTSQFDIWRGEFAFWRGIFYNFQEIPMVFIAQKFIRNSKTISCWRTILMTFPGHFAVFFSHICDFPHLQESSHLDTLSPTPDSYSDMHHSNPTLSNPSSDILNPRV